MKVDVDDRRQIVSLIGVVVVMMVVGSLGFQALSPNPVAPNVEVTATDAPDTYDTIRSGNVDMLAVSHTSGEPVDGSDLELLLGATAEGLWFNGTNEWTARSGRLVFGVHRRGERIDGEFEFGPGERLVVTKTSGTASVPVPFEVRVRVFHAPSQRRLLDEYVTIR